MFAITTPEPPFDTPALADPSVYMTMSGPRVVILSAAAAWHRGELISLFEMPPQGVEDREIIRMAPWDRACNGGWAVSRIGRWVR